jgi:putative transposase
MPRIGRVVLPGYPHHIIQRGHNRQVVFAETRDFAHYLGTLAEFKAVYGVKVYAYCLMTNHVHLLVAPQALSGLAQLMKRLAGRQTRYHNCLEKRTGTLWESRYKSSPVDSDKYLLACARYIELNPVRARMVAAPEQYPWSSCRHRLGQTRCAWLDEDPGYLGLGADCRQRQHRNKGTLPFIGCLIGARFPASCPAWPEPCAPACRTTSPNEAIVANRYSSPMKIDTPTWIG